MKTAIAAQHSQLHEGRSNFFPNELFQMYRRRLGITQKELAGLLGLNSSRMIRGWEAGDSLPKAERLCKLLEVCLSRGAFTQGQELTEAQQLWNCVKDFFDNNRVDISGLKLSSNNSNRTFSQTPSLEELMRHSKPE
jgi:transcriptional regulator with XRE-family HTH domain